VNDAIGGGGPFNVMDLTKGNLLVAQVPAPDATRGDGQRLVRAPGDLEEAADAPWHDKDAPGDARTTRPSPRTPCSAASSRCCFARTYFVVEQKSRRRPTATG
jgi:hypothetical protein